MNPLSQLSLSVSRLFAQATIQCSKDVPKCDTGLPQVALTAGSIQSVLQIVFGVLGAVAVIIIVIAGLQFIASQGDPQGVAKARMTIIYAAIGLGISLMAEAIVTFVLGRL